VKTIEVYADVWCPFAHVGLRCVVERRTQLGRQDVALDIRAWPLELVNGTQLDPETTADHVRDLRAQVAPDLFSKFDPEHFPSTCLPALACVHAAYRKDLRTGEAVSFALRDALFEKGLDISRQDVLSEVARANGVGPSDAADEKSVLTDWHEGVKRDVKGSPHFFCGDHDAFCPSLDILKVGKRHLDVKINLDDLDAFLSECFDG
jgi:predicted DsbA family dithiol-disulfide isomerase